ncbi:MAG: hypothetical protein KF824_06905 [Fimbriimonadaceae bacterium]|nr:MAG: hypothetical protein KF824_06905 [Fimbriimonadaceae bacterium]
MEHPSFRHSGKLGDAIYSLAGVQTFGLSDFYLACGSHISKAVGELLLPLLNEQPYIRSAKIWNGEHYEYNLDEFRKFGLGYNLADAHLIPLGLRPSCRDNAWLTVPKTLSIENRPVVFARSKDYRGIDGFWETVYSEFGSQAIFIGTNQEYADFIQVVGDIPHIQTGNMLQVAEVLAGSKLFVGNQSCPLAIAEGQKQPLIQEVCLRNPNCIFFRETCYPITATTQFVAVMNEIRDRDLL